MQRLVAPHTFKFTFFQHAKKVDLQIQRNIIGQEIIKESAGKGKAGT